MVGRPTGSFAISGWVRTEVASALAQKLRTGELDLLARSRAEQGWQKLLPSLVDLAVPVEAWNLAAQFVRQHELRLRASDALHLAVASLGHHSVATLDHGMIKAALELGIVVEYVPGA